VVASPDQPSVPSKHAGRHRGQSGPDNSSRARAGRAGTSPKAKLTLSQRVLTALPRLPEPKPADQPPETKTQPPATPRTKPARTAGENSGERRKPATNTDRGSDTKVTTGSGGRSDTKVKTGSNRALQSGTSSSPSAAPDLDTVVGTPVSANPPGFSQRLRASFLKPSAAPTPTAPGGKVPTKADPYPDVRTADLQHQIKWLDDRERLFTLLAAPLGAIVGIVGTVVAIQTNPAVGHKGHATTDTLLIYGVVAIVFAIATLISGLTRRRSFAVFSLLFMGYDSTTTGVYALPLFWGLAGWLFYKSYKMQRSLTARGAHPRQLRNKPASSRGSASSSARARPAGARAASAGRTAGPAAGKGGGFGRRRKPSEPTLVANRRYTPPKPKNTDR